MDWYPWGEEAFQKARKDNKPIFLSVRRRIPQPPGCELARVTCMQVRTRLASPREAVRARRVLSALAGGLQHLPLVSCDGARELRERGHRGHPQRAFRVHQGRPRGEVWQLALPCMMRTSMCGPSLMCTSRVHRVQMSRQNRNPEEESCAPFIMTSLAERRPSVRFKRLQAGRGPGVCERLRLPLSCCCRLLAMKLPKAPASARQVRCRMPRSQPSFRGYPYRA